MSCIRKKAFDTGDHKILLQKLAHYGIQVQELISYLFGRMISQGLMVLTLKSKAKLKGFLKAPVFVPCYF